MPDRWFYTHDRAAHGPVSAEQLRRLAATGGLGPDDLIWPESVDRDGAVRAEAALSFPTIPLAQPVRRPAAPLPEWVRALTDAGLDVRALEALPSPPMRDWLDDVRRVEQPPPAPPTVAYAGPLDEPAAPETLTDVVFAPEPLVLEPAPGWPLSQDYNEAIQNPAANFADPELKRGEAVVNALGIPVPHSGNFADVYQVRCPDGSRWAVKCFTREAPGLRERYQAISEHLRREKLPFVVDFNYLEKGIRAAGKWRPVLKMQWVEGLMLNQFVGEYAGDPAMLEGLSQAWARMAALLRAAGVGHCDLQHGNILLAPGPKAHTARMRLIDYDGMWVPALAGKKSGEVGHPSYQHPQRVRDKTYNIDVDRFPALLVATALRALQVGGRPLWEKFADGDGLLFKEADLVAPTKSPLFHHLIRSPDPRTAELADHLLRALRGGVGSAPLLEEVGA